MKIKLEDFGMTALESEMDCICLFSKIHHFLGFSKIIRMQNKFPDCMAIDKDGNTTYIEFEDMLSRFKEHLTNPDINKCDYIICNWRDVMTNYGKKVIVLRDLIKGIDKEKLILEGYKQKVLKILPKIKKDVYEQIKKDGYIYEHCSMLDTEITSFFKEIKDKRMIIKYVLEELQKQKFIYVLPNIWHTNGFLELSPIKFKLTEKNKKYFFYNNFLIDEADYEYLSNLKDKEFNPEYEWIDSHQKCNECGKIIKKEDFCCSKETEYGRYALRYYPKKKGINKSLTKEQFIEQINYPILFSKLSSLLKANQFYKSKCGANDFIHNLIQKKRLLVKPLFLREYFSDYEYDVSAGDIRLILNMDVLSDNIIEYIPKRIKWSNTRFVFKWPMLKEDFERVKDYEDRLVRLYNEFKNNPDDLKKLMNNDEYRDLYKKYDLGIEQFHLLRRFFDKEDKFKKIYLEKI